MSLHWLRSTTYEEEIWGVVISTNNGYLKKEMNISNLYLDITQEIIPGHFNINNSTH